MSFFKNFFNLPAKQKSTEVETNKEKNLCLDEMFVHNFVAKGGMFLYCLNAKEVADNLNNILKENNWNRFSLLDERLIPFFNKNEVTAIQGFDVNIPVFTSCEHLIVDNGDILFSSNQLKSNKLSEMPPNFIVYATTSQFVKSMGEGLTGIKTHYKENLPTNISAVKNYNINKGDDSFLNYGNSNSKNLYLLLLEDL